MVHVHVHVGPQAVKAAKERMERERERSQRRRDVAKLKVRQAIMRNARRFGGSMSRCSRPSMRRCEILTIGGPLASSAARASTDYGAHAESTPRDKTMVSAPQFAVPRRSAVTPRQSDAPPLPPLCSPCRRCRSRLSSTAQEDDSRRQRHDELGRCGPNVWRRRRRLWCGVGVWGGVGWAGL